MLVITRKINEGIVIDGKIKVVVLDSGKDKVKLGIEAPKDIRIVRNELFDTEKQNIEASNSIPKDILSELLKDKKE